MNEIEEATWDKRKILMAFIGLGLILLIGFKTLGPDKKVTNGNVSPSVEIKGVQTKDTNQNDQTLPENIQKNVEQKLNNLKREVNNINVVDVTTSSPAVQKVINDIKSLQTLPESQAKQACFKICNGL